MKGWGIDISGYKQNGIQRWKPSFIRRQGQLTRAQKSAMRQHWPRFGLAWTYGARVDLDSEWQETGPLMLEIGFGNGDNLLRNAQLNPSHRFLGIEVHRPAIGATLIRMNEMGLSNVRVMRGDVRLFLSDFLDGRHFSRICLFCPDPWPNDADRRLACSEVFELMALRAKPNCRLHLLTDVPIYADFAMAELAVSGKWCQTVKDSELDWRTKTHYERRGELKGHPIWEWVGTLAEDKG